MSKTKAGEAFRRGRVFFRHKDLSALLKMVDNSSFEKK
jgi:hypothetical protein